MEDFVTWTDTSKIRKHVLNYNEEVCGTTLLVSLGIVYVQSFLIIIAPKSVWDHINCGGSHHKY